MTAIFLQNEQCILNFDNFQKISQMWKVKKLMTVYFFEGLYVITIAFSTLKFECSKYLKILSKISKPVNPKILN